ncbi:MAG: hypothetical protein C0613_14390 [Desulfobulbaceae bacterium]|nr:MAG: hypothetical protein C0613_14390 [Desulfobulbaceae bacterium]
MIKDNCWIAEVAFEELLMEAQDKFPNETGGIFMGYQAKDGQDLVVTNVIGPGPNAVHKPCGYIPDVTFQEQQIAKIYRESGQLDTYLGDWHTHPLGKTLLSRKDKRTLRRIARHTEARIAQPIMAVLACSEPAEFSIWRYSDRDFLFCRVPNYIEMSIKVYG